ncbi:MAG: methytransferase partner Trm112 [Thermoplasmata archaeon]|nr:methytransferase partner Trm112 [Thermoplasmata archaeon]
MKKELMEILACPMCKHHPLDLRIDKQDDKEIIAGSIKCSKCGLEYPIEDGIPNMLPPEGSSD